MPLVFGFRKHALTQSREHFRLTMAEGDKLGLPVSVLLKQMAYTLTLIGGVVVESDGVSAWDRCCRISRQCCRSDDLQRRSATSLSLGGNCRAACSCSRLCRGTAPHSCWLSCAVASIHPRTLQRLCTPRRASGERKLNKCPKWRDKWPHRRRAPTYVNVTCTFTLIRVLSTAKPPKIALSGVRSGLSSNRRFLRPTRVCPPTASQPVQLARV